MIIRRDVIVIHKLGFLTKCYGSIRKIGSSALLYTEVFTDDIRVCLNDIFSDKKMLVSLCCVYVCACVRESFSFVGSPYRHLC